MVMRCKWCSGRGYINVERGSSLSYCCPDCNGSGEEQPEEEECEECGEWNEKDMDCKNCEEMNEYEKEIQVGKSQRA